MAFISISLIIIGFLLSVYGGVILSLANKMRTPSGDLDQSKITLFSIIMAVSAIMVIAGVLGYYFMRGNLPYYINN
jgi:hypothetical protein